MKTNKIKTIAVVVIIAITSIFANYSVAQSCKQQGAGTEVMSKCPATNEFSFIKDLTPEQNKQIAALRLNFTKESLNIKNLIAEKKAHIITLTTGDNIDMTAVNKTVDELFALKAELTKKHIGYEQEVRKLLNADQKVIFDVHNPKASRCHSSSGSGCSGQSSSASAGNCKSYSKPGCSSSSYAGCCKTQSSSGCSHTGSATCCKNKSEGSGCKTQQTPGCSGKSDLKEEKPGCNKK